MNSILAIHPYKSDGVWVFDDESVGLLREPFLAGADVIIDRRVADFADADEGFTLFFSDCSFPGHNARFEWLREEDGGNWYFDAENDLEGWLCPALFKYFEQAPQTLFIQFKPKPH